MRVRFYGVRGSCPTPGPSTVRYGGNSVCVEVRLADNTCIVLDAGTGIRELGNDLVREGYRGSIHLFITHSHWDHIMGLPFFAPLYAKSSRIVLHPMSPDARERTRSPILFDGVHFPVRFSDLPAVIERVEDAREHRISTARVTTVPLNHPGGAQGFRIDDESGASIAYLTDNELDPPRDLVTTPAALAEFAREVDVLVHDAQYLPSDLPHKRGWGHSQVDDTLALARASGCKLLALHHHDPDRNDAALDVVAAHATEWAAANAPGLTAVVAREGLVTGGS